MLDKIQKILLKSIKILFWSIVYLLAGLGKIILWIRQLFTSKAELVYWIDGNEHREIIRDFTEKSANSFQYVDWKTKRTSLVKTAEPISYKLTELDRHSD